MAGKINIIGNISIRFLLYAIVLFLIGFFDPIFSFMESGISISHTQRQLIVGGLNAFVVGVLVFGIEVYFRRLEAKNAEMERLNDEIKRQQLYLRHIIDSSLDIIITVNENREIVEFNKAAERIFGYSKEEAINKNIEMLYDSPEEAMRVHAAIMALGKYSGEVTNKRKDGSVFPAFIAASFLKDEGGFKIGVMGISRDISEIKRAENALKIAATMDKLTGAYNRHTFEEFLEKEVERTKRYAHPCTVIMFDIDHFKNVNDTYGHHIGDYVLKTLASLVLKNIRKIDIFGRWGGEEFMLLLQEESLEEGRQVAEKLRKYIEGYNFETVKFISASFGVAQYNQNESIHDFYLRLDAALYSAKNRGRNRVEISSIE